MTAIEATADAKVFKTGPFWNRRYTLALFINGKHAGISWDINRKQAKTMPRVLAENAAAVLESYGLMETAYGLAATGAAPAPTKELVTPDGATLAPPVVGGGFDKESMPFKGQRVALTVDMGKHFKKGLIGTVTRVDELIPGYAEENQYPVRVALISGADTVELPLHLHEIEVAR
jgi:hypothetical protein